MAGPPVTTSSPWSPLKIEDADEDGTAEHNAVSNAQVPNAVTVIPSLLSFFFKKIYLFILAVRSLILVEACGIFSCGIQDLFSCSMQNL